MKKHTLIQFLLIILITSCTTKETPKNKYYSFYQNSKIEYLEDSIVVKLNNPINSPLKYFLTSTDENLKKELLPYKIVILKPLSDSIITLPNYNDSKIILKNKYGNHLNPINKYPISFPFTNNSTYKVIQGYNGWYSHNHKRSAYAIDFDLKIGDTVCASDDGYVVGVIQNYSGHGGRDWIDFANYITLYHPNSNLFTQYVHLKTKGSFVKVGDTIKTGQAIGLSGMTGFTSSPHLHFNVLRATAKGLISEEINFIEGYKGKELIKDLKVEKNLKNNYYKIIRCSYFNSKRLNVFTCSFL